MSTPTDAAATRTATSDSSAAVSDLPGLLRALDADGERELGELLAAQHREAEAILQQARADGAQLVREAAAHGRRDGVLQAGVISAEAAAQARHVVESATAAALAAVADAAQLRIDRLTAAADGVQVTRRLLVEALQVLPGATRCHVPAGHGTAAKETAPSIRVHEDLPRVGAVAVDEHGRSVDNTASTRLRNIWPDLRGPLVTSWGEP